MEPGRGIGTAPDPQDRCLEEVPKEDIYYPESDGLPIGESELHIREIVRLLSILDWAFADRADVYVGADLLVYYEEDNPGAVVVPDILVARGVSKLPFRRSYRIWREGAPPTFVIEVTSRSSKYEDRDFKAKLYEEIGVQEYVLYDPNGEYLVPALQGFRSVGGRYEPMEVSGEGELVSEVLGLRLRLIDGRLQFSEPDTSAVLLDAETARRMSDERRVVAERQRALAEERVASLEAELARLRAQLRGDEA